MRPKDWGKVGGGTCFVCCAKSHIVCRVIIPKEKSDKISYKRHWQVKGTGKVLLADQETLRYALTAGESGIKCTIQITTVNS